MADPCLYALMTVGAKYEDIDKIAAAGLSLQDIQNPFLTQDELFALLFTRRQPRLEAVILAAREQAQQRDWARGLPILFAFGMTKYGHTQLLKYYRDQPAPSADTVAATLASNPAAFAQRRPEIEKATAAWQAWREASAASRLVAETAVKERAQALRERLQPSVRRSPQTNKALKYLGLDEFPDKLMTMVQRDFHHRDLFVARLSGQTLEQAGAAASLTRERVRQIFKKQLGMMPAFADVEPYRAMLANYALSQDDFVWLTHSSPLVWQYIRFLDGDAALRPGYEYIFASQQVPEESKVRYAATHHLLLTEDGEVKPLSQGAITQAVLAQTHGQLVSEAQFKTMLDAYLASHHLPAQYRIDNLHALSAAVTRLPVVQRIRGEFRAYQLDDARDFQAELVALFDVAPGIYGIQYFFDAAPELMALLDIQAPSELANIVHRLGLKHFTTINKMVRQSQLWIKTTNQDDFYLAVISQHEDQTMDAVIDDLHQAYGLHPGTMRALLLREYPAYFENGRVKLAHWEPQNVQFYSRARQALTQALYTDAQLDAILRPLDPALRLSNMLMAKLGYLQRGSLYLQERFGSVKTALESWLDQPKIPVARFTQLSNVNVNNWLREAVRQHRLTLISPTQYATRAYLATQGIDDAAIDAFLAHVHRVVAADEFFTWTSLQQAGFTDPLSAHKMAPAFFENLLFSTGEYAQILTQEPVFVRLCENSLVRPRIADFLKQIVTVPALPLSELQALMQTHYGVAMTAEHLIVKINQPGGTVFTPQTGIVYRDAQALAAAIDGDALK